MCLSICLSVCLSLSLYIKPKQSPKPVDIIPKACMLCIWLALIETSAWGANLQTYFRSPVNSIDTTAPRSWRGRWKSGWWWWGVRGGEDPTGGHTDTHTHTPAYPSRLWPLRC